MAPDRGRRVRASFVLSQCIAGSRLPARRAQRPLASQRESGRRAPTVHARVGCQRPPHTAMRPGPAATRLGARFSAPGRGRDQPHSWSRLRLRWGSCELELLSSFRRRFCTESAAVPYSGSLQHSLLIGFFFEEAVLMMELPKRHATPLEG